MRCRREERLSLRLRTVVSGVDRRGRVFREYADTLDFSTLGARIAGLNTELEAGSIVSLLQGNRCARFRVAWVGEPGTENEGQIGLQCVEVARNDCKRILYVDDQEHELHSRSGLLRTGGYDVVGSPTAQAAWQELLQGRFDLLLLDYPVIDADATAVVTAVRKYWPELRILVATSTPAAMPESLLACIDDWIHKGVLPAELLSRVAGLIGQASRLNWPVARFNPRYSVNVEVAMRIFRSGVPVMIRGRSVDLSASGMGVEFEDPVMPGEVGTIYFQLPSTNETTYSPRVVVRRRNRTYYGLEFVDVSAEEANAIVDACQDLPLMSAPVEL